MVRSARLKGRARRRLLLLWGAPPPPPPVCAAAGAPCRRRRHLVPRPRTAVAPVRRPEAPPPPGLCAAAAAVAGVWRGRHRRAVLAPPGLRRPASPPPVSPCWGPLMTLCGCAAASCASTRSGAVHRTLRRGRGLPPPLRGAPPVFLLPWIPHLPLVCGHGRPQMAGMCCAGEAVAWGPCGCTAATPVRRCTAGGVRCRAQCHGG